MCLLVIVVLLVKILSIIKVLLVIQFVFLEAPVDDIICKEKKHNVKAIVNTFNETLAT